MFAFPTAPAVRGSAPAEQDSPTEADSKESEFSLYDAAVTRIFTACNLAIETLPQLDIPDTAPVEITDPIMRFIAPGEKRYPPQPVIAGLTIKLHATPYMLQKWRCSQIVNTLKELFLALKDRNTYQVGRRWHIGKHQVKQLYHEWGQPLETVLVMMCDPPSHCEIGFCEGTGPNKNVIALQETLRKISDNYFVRVPSLFTPTELVPLQSQQDAPHRPTKLEQLLRRRDPHFYIPRDVSQPVAKDNWDNWSDSVGIVCLVVLYLFLSWRDM